MRHPKIYHIFIMNKTPKNYNGCVIYTTWQFNNQINLFKFSLKKPNKLLPKKKRPNEFLSKL